MQTLTEKRVFGTKSGTTEVFVASETGLVGVTVSADQIGEFGLAHHEAVRSVAASDRGVLVATDDDVLHSSHDEEPGQERRAQSRTFAPAAAELFGGAVAVGWGRQGPIAADSDGTVASLGTDQEASEAAEWDTVETTEGVRAVDGSLIAAADGVYRLTRSGLTHVGLDDARDVAGHGTPLAATADGLFRLGNGWLSVREGPVDRVASDGHGHVHAVGPDGLRRCAADGAAGADDTATGGDWIDATVPVGSPVVDVDYGGGIVAAVTENGTLCVDAGDGWRHQLLGVGGVTEIAVGPGSGSADEHRNRV